MQLPAFIRNELVLGWSHTWRARLKA